ncbi:MAG TPA: hypothetical protein VLK84_22665 [Longimicrobium sp.]|nr:hypothetical protein [Longimicrobium sp.]
MIRAVPFLALVAALHAHAAAAQGPAYARTPGDTLRYREVSERVMDTPGSPPRVRRQDATLAVAFAAGDTARAWYEALRLEAEGGGEARVLEDGPGRVFVLAFGARGVDTTLAIPAFPDPIRARADLRWQFWDFFPRLPAAPLLPGTGWADTIVRARTVEGGGNEMESTDTRIMRYQVVGDSSIGERAVVVVEAQGETNGVLSGRLFGVLVRGTSRETERGRFYFDAARGVLVRRTRTATGVLDLTLPEGDRPGTVHRTDQFSGTVELLEGEPR